MTGTQVATDVSTVQTIGNTILSTIAGLDPAVDVPAETAGTILNLAAGLATAALTALSNASGTPITAESVMALLPNATPLPEPS